MKNILDHDESSDVEFSIETSFEKGVILLILATVGGATLLLIVLAALSDGWEFIQSIINQ